MNKGKILKWLIALAVGVAAFSFGQFLGSLIVNFERENTDTVYTYDVRIIKGLGNIQMFMPENWESKIDEEGDKETTVHFMVEFAPKGEKGTAKLIYCDNATLATGERMMDGKEIVFGGKKAEANYPDKGEIPSYINFKGYTGEYVLYLKDIDWYTKYEKDLIMLIAESTFGAGIMNEEEAIKRASFYAQEGYNSVSGTYEAHEERWSVEFVYEDENSKRVSYVYLDLEGKYLGGSEILMCG